ncbi:MAG: Ger(x)C family spore germination C-terminal domain-containing protein [Clostridiales bacterium]|nr:Ger(x)C family spore germination C-terminal domain-containing protein [Clostridiales bacterium]
MKKSNEDSVSTAGIALFNDNKLVCVTDDEETLGFTLIAGKADSVLLEIEDDVYGKIGVRISDIQCKKSASVIDNNVCFNVKIEADMIIDEVQNSTESETQLNEIAGITEEHIKSFAKMLFFFAEIILVIACVWENIWKQGILLLMSICR